MIRDEYVRLREKILIQLEGMKDTDKAKFLRSELNLINQKIGSLEGFSSAYIERWGQWHVGVLCSFFFSRGFKLKGSHEPIKERKNV